MSGTAASASARYRDYAAARGRILTAAMKRIPLTSVAQQARTLSLWNGKAVEPADEVQLAMVFDLGVLDPVGEHQRGLDRQLKAEPPAPGSAEGKVAQALLRAEFGIFRLLGPHPEGGARIERFPGGEQLWLMDRFLGQRPPGGLFGARLIWPDEEFAMTCGTIVPLDSQAIEHLLLGVGPQRGPVLPRLTAPEEDAPAIERILAEPAARMRLESLPRSPGFAARVYRTAIDLGLAGPIPRRTPPQ